MAQFLEMLKRLNATGVEYVLIGGMAARAHGSPLPTEDLDICCAMTPQNMEKLLAAIGTLHPIFRDPRRIPLPQNADELSRFRTMLLLTDLCKLDVLKEIDGVGGFEDVLRDSVLMDFEGLPVRILSFDALVRAKAAAGREKDKRGVMHLEAVRKRKPPEEK